MSLLDDFPHLAPLHGELHAAWLAVEGARIDDPFAGVGMIRLGNALVAYHKAVRACRADVDAPLRRRTMRSRIASATAALPPLRLLFRSSTARG